MREFEFQTGVRQSSGSKLFGEYQQWRHSGSGQVKVILFYADVPEKSTFLFATDYDNLLESKSPDVIVAPITGGLLSKFGYFRVPSL